MILQTSTGPLHNETRVHGSPVVLPARGVMMEGVPSRDSDVAATSLPPLIFTKNLPDLPTTLAAGEVLPTMTTARLLGRVVDVDLPHGQGHRSRRC